jgi:threonine/homoserine/homoserine lactone efflux protein
MWAGLALAGTMTLMGHRPLHFSLAAFGTALLLHASWRAVAASSTDNLASPPACPGRRSDFTAGLLLSLTNPLALVFWSGTVSVLGLGGGIWNATSAPAVVLALAVGALAWSVGAAVTISCGRHAVGRGSLRFAEVLAGMALGFFGLRMLWETTSLLVSVAGL